VATDAVAPNTQWLHGQAPAANQASVQVAGHAAARVPIDTAVAGPNVQEIGADKLAANRQALAGLSALATNRQPLGADSDGDHLEALPPEVRVEQLYQTIESLKDQLDRFESKNKKILAAVRQAKQVQEKQKSESESLQDTVALLPVDIPKSAEGVAKSPLTANIQAVGAEVLTTNVQDIGAEVYALNRQTLAPTEPRQPVDLSSPAPPLVPHAQQALTVTVASAEGLHMAAELLPTLTEEASPVASAVSIKAPSSKAKRLQPAHSGRGHPFKIYVRVAATFVVLSCWTSNIAAIDRLYPQRVTGKLETLSPSQSWVETTVLQAPDI
jgi:hypothetical protein